LNKETFNNVAGTGGDRAAKSRSPAASARLIASSRA